MIEGAPQYFGTGDARLGHLFDYLYAQTSEGALPAGQILLAVLESLGPIWPGRLSVGGVNLGDVWRHSQISGPGMTAGLVPFHKLSQWLTYSLIEPILAAGITVTGVDELTGLAEYRNGGLLLDLELLTLRHDPVLTPTYPLRLKSSWNGVRSPSRCLTAWRCRCATTWVYRPRPTRSRRF